MAQTVRFGVSIDEELLEAFDRLVDQLGYSTRSEAIRDLIRERLSREETDQGNVSCVGVLCYVYDHDAHDLAHRIMHLQHEYCDEIVSALHVHLDAHNCLEAVVLRGRAANLQKLAGQITATRGIQHGQLVLTTTRAKKR